MDDWKKVYIDQDKEISTVITQLTNMAEDKFILVVHENNHLFRQKTNLQLLEMYLKQSGKEFALSTDCQPVLDVARSLKISIVTEEGENVPEIMPKKKKTSIIRPQYLAMVAVLAAMIVGAVFLYQNWPEREIELVPTQKTIKISEVLEFSPEYKETSLGNLPATVVEKELELKESAPSTGKKVIGVTKAEGRIALINETGSNARLAVGTRVTAANGVGFVLSSSVVVPCRKVERFMGVPVGLKAGQAEARVVAEAMGSSGNISSKSINQMVCSGVRAINPSSFSGGTDKEIAIVSEADVQSLNALIQDKMKKALQESFEKDKDEGDFYIPESFAYLPGVFSFDKKVGDEAPSLTITAKGKAKMFMASNKDVQKSAKEFLIKKAGEDYILSQKMAEIELKTGALTDPNHYKIEIEAKTAALADLGRTDWAKELKGLDNEAIKKKLQGVPEIASFDIKVKKELKWLPVSWQKTSVVIKK